MKILAIDLGKFNSVACIYDGKITIVNINHHCECDFSFPKNDVGHHLFGNFVGCVAGDAVWMFWD